MKVELLIRALTELEEKNPGMDVCIEKEKLVFQDIQDVVELKYDGGNPFIVLTDRRF